MLYLLRTFTRGGSYLKIGYTKDFNKRFNSYDQSNPGIESIGIREGDEEDEKLLHLFLHFSGFPYLKNEWYKDDDRILQLFHESRYKIRKYIWNNRDKIFRPFREENKNLYLKLWSEFGIQEDIGEIEKTYLLKYQVYSITSLNPEEIKELDTLLNIPHLARRYKYFCALPETMINSILPYLPESFTNYYTVLGVDRMRALGYNATDMRREYEGIIGNQEVDIKTPILNAFEVGKYYTKTYIKKKLSEIYKEFDYFKTAKALDLGNYFIIKDKKIPNEKTGKRDAGYLVVRIRENTEG